VFLFSCSKNNEQLRIIINGDNIQKIFGQWRATFDGPFYLFEKEEEILKFAYRESNNVPKIERGVFTVEGSQIILHTTTIGVPGYTPTYVDNYRTIICYIKGNNLIIDGVVFVRY